MSSTLFPPSGGRRRPRSSASSSSGLLCPGVPPPSPSSIECPQKGTDLTCLAIPRPSLLSARPTALRSRILDPCTTAGGYGVGQSGVAVGLHVAAALRMENERLGKAGIVNQGKSLLGKD